MNRRTFLAQAVAAALVPKELLTGDGVALKSTFHPTWTGYDLGFEPPKYYARYVHATYGMAFSIDPETGERGPVPKNILTAMNRALEHSMKQLQDNLATPFMRPESLEEMEIDIADEPSGRIRLAPHTPRA